MPEGKNLEIVPAYDARGIANFILDRGLAHNIGVTNMAMNKVLFFAHAWFLGTANRPLVIQTFEAWQHGPVVQDIYHAFKKFGDNAITERARRLDRLTAQYVVCEVQIGGSDIAPLTDVVDFYIQIPALELRDMSHEAGGPWHRVWNYEGKSNPGMVIPNELIREHYNRNRLSH